MRFLFTSLLLLGCSANPMESHASASGLILPNPPTLFADFDNKAVGQPIGVRGGVFGEPVDLDNLDTEVVATSPGQNVLRVSNDLAVTNARTLQWQLLDDTEIAEGEVKISFDFTPSALDNYRLYVRESGTSSRSFLSLNFSQSGRISASDANGAFTLSPNTYAANVIIHVDLVFDMDAKTSSVAFNGTTIANARAFGVTDRGIGQLAVGYGSSSSGSPFDLDNLVVTGPLPFPVVLDADFQDKTVGQPIGVGGARLHEPYQRDSYLDAIVTEPVSGIRVLDISASNLAQSRALRWQFLDNLEATTGLVVLDFNVAFSAKDVYNIIVRETSTAAQKFTDINFKPTGTIQISDANGIAVMNAGNYAAGQVYNFRIIHNVDTGTYDIFRNGVALLRERSHGVTGRGPGALLFAIGYGASTSSHMQMDSLHVQVTGPLEGIFADGFEESIGP
ncbi:MAG TPA: hypothetical protein VFN13_02165 [Rudaea sp.]|nr:hypothetical protein [Rudaea sp.]